MRTRPPADELETLEIASLLEAVRVRFGYDFRDYALASLRRRIWMVAEAEGVHTVSGAAPRPSADASGRATRLP